jgi:hypothetical protein
MGKRSKYTNRFGWVLIGSESKRDSVSAGKFVAHVKASKGKWGDLARAGKWGDMAIGKCLHIVANIVAEGERLRLGCGPGLGGGTRRAPCLATVGEGERLRLGRGHVQWGGGGRAPRCATVAKGERLRLGRGHVQCGGGGWAPRCATVAEGERLRVGLAHVHPQWGGGGGHVRVLQWARANGCDWDRATCLRWAPAGSETSEGL